MNLELISDSDWISVLDGSREFHFEFLALQLFLVNLRDRWLAKEVSTQDCIGELKSFYSKFRGLPMAEHDFEKIASRRKSSSGQLLDPRDAARRIAAGQSLVLAGEEALLASMPPGNWIGGTIPYFMDQSGACLCKDRIFVTEIPADFQAFIRKYDPSKLAGLYQDAEERAISIVILPADSPTHAEFALRAPRYPGFALHPLVGWVAGIDLEMAGRAKPKVFCGGPDPLGDAAAVMRLKVPSGLLAQIKIINLFQRGDGDAICFPETGFSATTAIIGGKPLNFAEYLRRLGADTRLPLVANYCGAMVNVSLKDVDERHGRVAFYAPVVAGVEYKLAKPPINYDSEFEARLKESSAENVLFSCNCILNYLTPGLKRHAAGPLAGPFTFGEIAFQLLNQTLVYTELVKVETFAPAQDYSPIGSNAIQLSAAHEELEASERRFRALSEAMPLGIFLTDPAGKLLYENQVCLKYRGVSSRDAGNGDWLSAVHPSDLPGIRDAFTDSNRQGGDFDHEFRFQYPDGQVRWVHSRTASLRSESGRLTGRVGLVQDITERKQAEMDLERVNQDLIKASREAGMAEVATGVLHNVKNIINSINVSAGVIAEQMRSSKSSNLGKVAAMLREHAGDLGAFLTEHPKGKLVPAYLEQLAEQLVHERGAVLEELKQFASNVEHIKEIVSTQQSYARMGGVSQNVSPADLMEDSLKINSAGLARLGIQVVREYEPNLPDLTVEKHKVLQVLVNFIQNAKYACVASERSDRKLLVRAANGGEFVRFAVTDNGVGIAPENLERVFQFGFTTKKSGHGFGLHSAVLTVRELGGDIEAHSDGLGHGATFTLKLPFSGRS